MKMIRNNKTFPLLNIINYKPYPYGSEGIQRHYNYWSDTKLGRGIFEIKKIPCICHACTTILSLYWYSKIKEAVNKTIHGKVYNCKYYQIIGCHNN